MQSSAADARMEEMRQLIERGRGAGPRSASPALFTNPHGPPDLNHLRNLVTEAERDLKKAAQSHQALQAELKLVGADGLDVSAPLIFTDVRHSLRFVRLDIIEGSRARKNKQ